MATISVSFPFSKNVIGRKACYIRMAVEPYEYIYVIEVEEGFIHYRSKEGHTGAMVLRNEKAARKFIYDNKLDGYVPVPCFNILEDDGSLN